MEKDDEKDVREKSSGQLRKKAKRPATRTGRPVGRKSLKGDNDALRDVYVPDKADEVG